MIVFAWSLFVIVVSFLVARNQAFLNAHLPAHAASSYSISPERQAESIKVTHGTNGDNGRTVDSKFNDNVGEETVYVIAYNEKKELNARKQEPKDTASGDSQNPLDPWSIAWYIGSFGGLVIFFLIVSCSEWCCRRGRRSLTVPYAQHAGIMNSSMSTEVPPSPPPYHLFGPPSYDAVNYGEIVDKTSNEKLDIYVISMPNQRPAIQEPV